MSLLQLHAIFLAHTVGAVAVCAWGEVLTPWGFCNVRKAGPVPFLIE